MNDSLLLLVIVIATAIAFDFTNGFHDTANAMATSIATRALKPKVAVGLCALLNFAGAFLSIKVSLAISSGIVDAGVLDLPTIFAALIGAIAWNLLAWAAGLHSSSSHALIGGLVGAGLVAGRTDAIGLQPDGEGHRSRDPLPADLRPRRTVGHIAPRSLRRRQGDQVTRSYRDGQIGTASLVALAHGTNDARKTMGVITPALGAHASLSGRDFSVPLWAERLAAGSIATGTYVGGWRIIRTIGRRLTEIGPPQ